MLPRTETVLAMELVQMVHALVMLDGAGQHAAQYKHSASAVSLMQAACAVYRGR